MIRVLMTADAIGGVWTYAVELCRALLPHQVEVVLATMGDLPSGDQRRQLAALPNVTLYVSRFRLEWMSDPWDDVRRAGDWLLELERASRPDLVHLNGYVHAALDWHAPVLVVGHSCVVSWWAAVKRDVLPDHWLDYAARVSEGLRAASHLVAPSQAMLDCLRRHYRGLPAATVIYNGRSRQPFRAAKKLPYVLSAGRLWDEAKNLAALCAVAARLPWPVLVAGDAAGDAAAAPAGGATSQMRGAHLLGRLDEKVLAERLSRAAIYALPARYEPFGLSVLEAALSGCALVLGDIPSLREVWDDAALYVSPDDPEAIYATLHRCIDRRALRTEMATRARLRARRYTIAQMASAYLDVYREMTCAPRPALSSRFHVVKG